MAIVIIAHEKGGVGKTTLAFNLASFFADFIPTKIIDLDSNRMFTTLNDYRGYCNLKAFDVVDPTTLLEEEKYALLSEYEGADDKLLLVDSGGYDSSENSRIMGIADFILIPAGNKMVEILALQKYEKVLDRIRAAKKEAGYEDEMPCFVVFNRVHPNTRNYEETDLGRFLAESQHYTLLKSVIKDRSSFNSTLVAGGYTVLEKGRFDAKKEICDLGEEISEILYKKLNGEYYGK